VNLKILITILCCKFIVDVNDMKSTAKRVRRITLAHDQYESSASTYSDDDKNDAREAKETQKINKKKVLSAECTFIYINK
jgi:hypothetical protein